MHGNSTLNKSTLPSTLRNDGTRNTLTVSAGTTNKAIYQARRHTSLQYEKKKFFNEKIYEITFSNKHS